MNKKMHERYDFSFVIFIRGHNKRTDKLLQSDSILTSIGNDHGADDKWIMLCCEDMDITRENVRNQPSTEEGSMGRDDGGGVMERIRRALPRIFHAGIESDKLADESSKKYTPWYRKASKDIYLNVQNHHRLNENVYMEAINNFQLSHEMKSLFRTASESFEFNKCTISNPPKSGKTNTIFTFGIGPSDSLHMKIYSTRKLPKNYKELSDRFSMFNSLIAKCQSLRATKEETVSVYNEMYFDLDKRISKFVNNSDFIEQQHESFMEKVFLLNRHQIYETYSQSKKTQSNNHTVECTPISILFFFSSTDKASDDSITGTLKNLSQSIISEMRKHEQMFVKLTESIFVDGAQKIALFTQLSEKKPSPNSIRMLLKELSLICTKYADQSLAYTVMIFNVFLKAWVKQVTPSTLINC